MSPAFRGLPIRAAGGLSVVAATVLLSLPLLGAGAASNPDQPVSGDQATPTTESVPTTVGATSVPDPDRPRIADDPAESDPPVGPVAHPPVSVPVMSIGVAGFDDWAAAGEIVAQASSLTIDKTVYAGHDGGASCAGGESVVGLAGTPVSYCFTVTNVGDSSLTDVRLDDRTLDVDEQDMTILSGSLADLAPNESVSLVLEETLQNDLVNYASASATAPTGPDPTDEDTADVDQVVPAISIDHTVYLGHDGGASCDGAASVAGESGDAVTYCFSVENIGDVTLIDVEVDAPELGIDERDMNLLSGSYIAVQSGAEVDFFFESIIDGDLISRATVSATAPVGPDPTADDRATVDELRPAIAIDQTVYAGHDGGASCEGGELVVAGTGHPLTYCFAVTNVGDTPLTEIEVVDRTLDVDEQDMSVLTGTLSGLPQAESVLLFFETTVRGDLLTQATARATSPGGLEVSDDDTAAVDEVQPAVAIDKTVYLGDDDGASCPGPESVSGEHGRPVTYCFRVTNVGDTGLTDIGVVDPDLGIDERDMAVLQGSLSLLDPGNSVTLFFDAEIDADLVNTARATAHPFARRGIPVYGFEDGVAADDSASVQEAAPDLTIDKTVYAGHDGGDSCAGAEQVGAESGAPITYCFSVTNQGELPLDVEIVDADLSIDHRDMTVLAGVLVGLQPGESVDLFHEAVLVGDLVNTAVATGSTPSGVEVSDQDTARVEAVDPLPVDLVIEKTARPLLAPVSSGVVGWDIVVANVGPGDDPGPIAVVDELPHGLRFVAASGPGWDCSHLAGVVTCVWPQGLASGRSTTAVELLTSVEVERPGRIVNEAIVSSSVTEAVVDNNVGFDAIEVTTDPPGPDRPDRPVRPNGATPLARTGTDAPSLAVLGAVLIVVGGLLRVRQRVRPA